MDSLALTLRKSPQLLMAAYTRRQDPSPFRQAALMRLSGLRKGEEGHQSGEETDWGTEEGDSGVDMITVHCLHTLNG